MPFRKHSLWLALLVLALVIGGGIWVLLLSPLSPLQSRTPEAVISVNGEAITADELEQAYQEFLREYRASLSGDERLQFDRQLMGAPGAYYRLQLKAQIAEDLIRETLLRQAAQELGVEVKQSEVLGEVKRRIWRFLEQNGVPPERIEQALRDPKTYRSPFTLDLLEKTRWEMLEERLRQRVVGVIQPTREELRAYYEKYRLRYYTPELVRVRHILVRVPEDAPPERVEAARKRIEEIYEQWKAGTSFEELARRYSEDELSAPQGGDYGWIQRGDPTGEAFVDLVFSLREPGEVGGPVRTKRGFHLIQLIERRPERGATFESVADEVLQDYILETTQERYSRWYKERHAQAEIAIKDPLLAAYRLEAQDREAARRAYERARDKRLVDDPYLGYYIARLYREELSEVERELEKLEGGDPKVQELRARAENLKTEIVKNLKDVLDRGRRERDIYEAILEIAPEDVEARFGFARWLLEQGRWDEAAEQLARVLELDPEHAKAHAAYGRLLLRMREFSKAAQHLERALALRPEMEGEERIELRLALAEAYKQLGQAQRARELWTSVLQDDPNSHEAHRQLAQLAQAEGDFAGALRHLEAALKGASSGEGKAQLWAEIGQLHLSAGDLERAEEAFQNALQESEDLPEAYLGLGDLARRRGDETQALEFYRQGWDHAVGWDVKEQLAQRILELQPDDIKLRFKLAELYKQRKRYDNAIGQYEQIVGRRPEELQAWHALGDTYVEQRRYDEAVQAYEEGLKHAGSPDQQIGLWAKIYYAERRRGKPLTDKGLEALYQLASLEVAQGQYEQAADYLSKLLAADPDYRKGETGQLIEQLRRQGISISIPSSSSPPSSDSES
jgi:peptidyl-prolyl cis-trans isomerase C